MQTLRQIRRGHCAYRRPVIIEICLPFEFALVAFDCFFEIALYLYLRTCQLQLFDRQRLKRRINFNIKSKRNLRLLERLLSRVSDFRFFIEVESVVM